MWHHPEYFFAILDSPWDIGIVLLVVLILFGGKKIPEMMRGLGQGLREFKEGMSGTSHSQAAPPAAQTPTPAEKPAEEKK